MLIGSISKKNTITIGKNKTLSIAAQLMYKNHVGCLVVTKSTAGRQTPEGIITDRDIALAINLSPEPQEALVNSVMVSHPVTAKKTESVFTVSQKMKEHGVKRMPVVNNDGSLYGIVCADDLLDAFSEEISNLSKVTGVQINKERSDAMPGILKDLTMKARANTASSAEKRVS